MVLGKLVARLLGAPPTDFTYATVILITREGILATWRFLERSWPTMLYSVFFEADTSITLNARWAVGSGVSVGTRRWLENRWDVLCRRQMCSLMGVSYLVASEPSGYARGGRKLIVVFLRMPSRLLSFRGYSMGFMCMWQSSGWGESRLGWTEAKQTLSPCHTHSSGKLSVTYSPTNSLIQSRGDESGG